MYLVPEELLRGEISESLLKVQTSLEVLLLFRSTFEERRLSLRQFQKNGSSLRPWDFSPRLVFSRLDRFASRVKTIEVSMESFLSSSCRNAASLGADCGMPSLQDILLTAVDLLKLEKLEIGGVRGRALSQQVQQLHQEFTDTYKFLTEKPYDCLDMNNMV